MLEQALQLPDKERGKLAVELLRTLEPDDDDELAPDEWKAAWSIELDRRGRLPRTLAWYATRSHDAAVGFAEVIAAGRRGLVTPTFEDE